MGKLQKMKLEAYDNSLMTGSPVASVEVPVNPDNYKLTKDIGHSENKEQGQKDTTVHFNKYEKENLSFSVVFDGTGVIPSTNMNTVTDKVKELEKVVYNCNNKIHQPNFVRIAWGKLVFCGQLSTYSLNYTLFSSEGVPLRVKIDMAFSRAVSQEVAVKLRENASIEEVNVEFKEGDTVSKKCYTMYDNELVAKEVAKENDLDRFRNIEPGTQLVFPALK
ncbi:hypothetical protein [uncultured Parabacteroides sp.]|uniref:CIS tube protein n=1 Tax=uncultured Parabacteroides sp. TaxID=512312 RepID=UPI00280545F4|nr:hypothetical protein [uncultured Parabacteroides sp.]MBD9166018.1 hypothetical protein [Parabacteroides johnsonii]